MAKKTSFTYELTMAQQELLLGVMLAGNYRKRTVPYSLWSIEGEKFNATLYAKEKYGKRKFCVQGAGAEDFVLFVLEPKVLGGASLGYEETLNPQLFAPHGGSDESGKGDFFGPLVVAAVYTDERIAKELIERGVKDCKQMSDKAVLASGAAIRKLVGPRGYAVVKLSPPAYNRLYAKMRNINSMLAWAHAAAIEELLEKRPDCPRVLVDQFASTEATILRALKPRGKAAEIAQRHKAESDIAVAAASVVAREIFLRDIQKMSEEIFPPAAAAAREKPETVPMGSSDPRVIELARRMVCEEGPKWLMNHVKAHFRTTDTVLAACGKSRDDLPAEGRVRSKMATEAAER